MFIECMKFICLAPFHKCFLIRTLRLEQSYIYIYIYIITGRLFVSMKNN